MSAYRSAAPMPSPPEPPRPPSRLWVALCSAARSFAFRVVAAVASINALMMIGGATHAFGPEWLRVMLVFDLFIVEIYLVVIACARID